MSTSAATTRPRCCASTPGSSRTGRVTSSITRRWLVVIRPAAAASCAAGSSVTIVHAWVIRRSTATDPSPSSAAANDASSRTCGPESPGRSSTRCRCAAISARCSPATRAARVSSARLRAANSASSRSRACPSDSGRAGSGGIGAPRSTSACGIARMRAAHSASYASTDACSSSADIPYGSSAPALTASM